MSQYPDIESLLNIKDQKVVLVVYRSPLSILSDMVLFLLALIVVIILNLLFRESVTHLRWLAIIPLLLFINIFRTYFNDVIHFELDKLTQYHGRLALSYGMPAIKYVDIRGINVVQDIIGRLFNYGDLQLGTPGATAWEVTLHGVRAPRELAKLIDSLRSWATENIEHQNVEESSTIAVRSRE